MDPISFIDRQTGKTCNENVYGGTALKFLYGNGFVSRFFGAPLAFLLARIPFISAFYGYLQKHPSSKKKVLPFIKEHEVDITAFAADPASYKSFNDFFIRHLKPSARPIDPQPDVAIIPADGRYLFYQNITEADGFVIKGQKFKLNTLLENPELAAQYEHGAMVISRLCPSDYHRYHFPCDCIPGTTHYINGWLYSVNPMAIKKDIEIFTQNKRTLCSLETSAFGNVLFLEVGATFVGSIHQTYTPGLPYKKGAEKGYFSFGGSSLILLFPPNSIKFDHDLLKASLDHTEIRCLMGQSMGKAIKTKT